MSLGLTVNLRANPPHRISHLRNEKPLPAVIAGQSFFAMAVVYDSGLGLAIIQPIYDLEGNTIGQGDGNLSANQQ
jgi:hypothetical protein